MSNSSSRDNTKRANSINSYLNLEKKQYLGLQMDLISNSSHNDNIKTRYNSNEENILINSNNDNLKNSDYGKKIISLNNLNKINNSNSGEINKKIKDKISNNL